MAMEVDLDGDRFGSKSLKRFACDISACDISAMKVSIDTERLKSAETGAISNVSSFQSVSKCGLGIS